jgi:hypothetical protein
MRKLLALATMLVAVIAFPAAASAAVAPGTYTPTADSFNPRECTGQLAPHVGYAVVHG